MRYGYAYNPQPGSPDKGWVGDPYAQFFVMGIVEVIFEKDPGNYVINS